MDSSRKILRPRLTLQLPTDNEPDAAARILGHAIAARTCILATYNRGRVKLAPYLLYERDDALFVDAVTVQRDGQVPREPKLGAFRLSGLSAVSLTPDRFQPEFKVPIDDARYAGNILSQV